MSFLVHDSPCWPLSTGSFKVYNSYLRNSRKTINKNVILAKKKQDKQDHRYLRCQDKQDKFYLVYPTAVGDSVYLVFIKKINLLSRLRVRGLFTEKAEGVKSDGHGAPFVEDDSKP